MNRWLCRLSLPALLLITATGSLEAQDTEAEVRAVVDRLFDAMRAQDTTAIRSTFHPEVRLALTSFRDGQPVIRLVTGDAFIETIGAATESLDEQIADVQIRVDDNIATVWNRYVFYIGDRLDHCGVDAFTMVRTTEGWKVLHVADTQRTEGCEPL